MAGNIISMADYLRSHPQDAQRPRKKRPIRQQQTKTNPFPRPGPRRPAA